MPAEALGCSLVSGRGGLSGLLTNEKPARNAFTRGWSNYPLSPMEAPITKNRPEVGLEGAVRFIHHVQCEHALLSPKGSLQSFQRLASESACSIVRNIRRVTCFCNGWCTSPLFPSFNCLKLGYLTREKENCQNRAESTSDCI